MDRGPEELSRAAPDWPAELDEIDAPPAGVWVRGDRRWLSVRPRVAVVGSRSPTSYGENQARLFASALARAGAVVVSGLARGVDAAAHGAALEAGGGTIAVLGCGVDRPWPSGPLADDVAARGLLLAELPPGTPPRRHHFPRRNRLISGLSAGVLVIEAAFASGSLITARWAADQGRAVWAVPGRVDHPMARGCHRLLREGAALVESPEEIAAELGLETAAGAGPPEVPEISDAARRVLDALVGETLTADEVAAARGAPVEDVLTALVELELAGAVVRRPGGLFERSGGALS